MRVPARFVVLSGLAVLAVLVSSCVTPAQNRQDALVRITHQYNDGLRWGRYQDVIPHLAAAEAARFMARTGALADDFEMADDEVASISFRDHGMRADVTVDYTWYNQRRALLRRTLVAQEWRYEDGRWICAVQRRLRGDRFPLITEPLAAISRAALPIAAGPDAMPGTNGTQPDQAP